MDLVRLTNGNVLLNDLKCVTLFVYFSTTASGR